MIRSLAAAVLAANLLGVSPAGAQPHSATVVNLPLQSDGTVPDPSWAPATPPAQAASPNPDDAARLPASDAEFRSKSGSAEDR